MEDTNDPRELDRRHFLKCMAWVGTGLVWGVSGGVATSRALGQPAPPDRKATFRPSAIACLRFWNIARL